MNKLIRFFRLNAPYLTALPRSLYYNFKCLKFREALRFPIFLSNSTTFNVAKGSIVLQAPALQAGMIKIGFNNCDYILTSTHKSLVSTSPDATITFRGYAYMGAGTRISARGGADLIVGNHLWITGDSLIIARLRIELADNCNIAWKATIMDHDAHNIYDAARQLTNPPQPVFLGQHTWIGCNVTLLKGASVPAGSLVAAGSVVTRNFTEQNCIIGGVPAKTLKTEITWGD